MADSIAISQLAPAVVFVNPTAGSGRARSALAGVRGAFEVASVPADFIATANAEELARAARDALKRGKRLLVALGGDGTFQALVNAAHGAEVLLGVLPGGGGNDFADALGLPPDPVAAATAILRGEARWADVARARTADGRERLYVGGGGLGIDAEAARHAGSAFRNWPGRSRYIASALRALATHRAARIRAEFPQSDLPIIEMNALLAAALNTPTYGAGIRLAPEARMDDGWLDIAVIEDMSKMRVLTLLPRLAKSGELPAGKVKRFRARTVRLTAEPASMFHGDGEILGPAPVEIEVLPHAIQVLCLRGNRMNRTAAL